MKIIHTADWHIGKNLNDYSLLSDQEYYFDVFIKKLSEIRPDLLLICGDIYDRSVPSAEAVSLLNRILKKIVLELKIKTVIIAGNHDSKERLGFLSELLEDSGLFVVGTLEKEIKKISVSNCDIYPIPYIEPHDVKNLYPDESFKTADEAFSFYIKNGCPTLDKARFNIAAAHGTFIKSGDGELTVGGSDVIDGAVFSEFNYTALGHIHTRKGTGYKNVYYSGSPLKYSVDEAGQKKSFSLITTEENLSYTSEEIFIPPLRDVRIIKGRLDEIVASNEFEASDDYIFFELSDEVIKPNGIQRLKVKFKNVLGLKYVMLERQTDRKIGEGREKIKRKSLPEAFDDFYFEVTEKRFQEQEMDYIKAVYSEVGGEKE